VRAILDSADGAQSLSELAARLQTAFAGNSKLTEHFVAAQPQTVITAR
jgi:uncharacterized protein (DUF1800 family)